MAARRARHRLGDRAHAANGVAPDPLLAVHLAERMMQHHIGRARRVGAGVIADDGVKTVQRLDQVALEPLVQHLAGRAREQIEQAALLFQRQFAQDVGGAERVERLAHCADPERFHQVRRRAQHQLAQHIRDLFQLAGKTVDPLRVAHAEFCHGLMGAAFAGQKIAAVGCGQKVLRLAFDHPQAVLGQFQVRRDLRVQQTDGVGRDRISKTGMKRFGHRGAAFDLAAVDQCHAQPGHREVRRASEAVMARADDQDVGFGHPRRPGLPRRPGERRDPSPLAVMIAGWRLNIGSSTFQNMGDTAYRSRRSPGRRGVISTQCFYRTQSDPHSNK